MSVYSVNSVTIKPGSAKVIGNSTEFTTYIGQGDIFKISDESVFYDIASVNSATNLTLSSNYENSNYWGYVTNEVVATGLAATKMYSGYIDNVPILANTVTINASYEHFTDNGAGTLSGDASPPGSGTIDYNLGSFSITLGSNLTATADFVASYQYGTTMSGMNYQILTSFTPHLSIPELSTSDTNSAYIITKAFRVIDSNFYKHKSKTISVDYTATNTDFTILLSGNSSKTRVKLPKGSSGNVGRHLVLCNNSASDLIASRYNASDLIYWSNNKSGAATHITDKYGVRDFYLATANSWLVK